MTCGNCVEQVSCVEVLLISYQAKTTARVGLGHIHKTRSPVRTTNTVF